MNRRFPLFISVLMTMAACLSPADIRIDESDAGGRVVISGQVSTLSGRTFAELGLTTSTGSRPVAVPGAEVELVENNAFRYTLIDHPERPGVYVLNGFTGIPGTTYHLEAQLPDGRTYRSADEVLPVTSGTDDISHSFELVENIDADGALVQDARIRIETKPQLPGSGQRFFKWSVEEVFLIRPTDFPDPFGYVPPDCFVTQPVDPQRVVLFDGRAFTGQFPEPQLLATRNTDKSFYYKHYFTTYLSSMTETAFDYWLKVRVVASQSGSIFDTPPAIVEGNVDGPGGSPVYGYFQSVNETFSRFSIQRTDLPPYAFLNEYCDFSYERNYDKYPGECLDCIKYRNSSYLRPDWF